MRRGRKRKRRKLSKGNKQTRKMHKVRNLLTSDVACMQPAATLYEHPYISLIAKTLRQDACYP